MKEAVDQLWMQYLVKAQVLMLLGYRGRALLSGSTVRHGICSATGGGVRGILGQIY